MAQRRPHILLITSDQQRGDALGIAGHPVLRTPNLDYLAGNGAWFRSAFSESPTCIPARRVILSGQAPVTNGMVGFYGGYHWNLRHSIASELAAAGYQTELIGKTHWHPGRKRFGFQHMLVANSQRDGNDYAAWLNDQGFREVLAGKLHGVETNSFNARPSHLPEGYDLTTWCVNESLKLISRRDPEAPLFLWVSVVDPHPPFTPPKMYFDRYMARADDIPEPFVGDWARQFDKPNLGLNIQPVDINLPDAWMRRMRAAYYGLVNHIDDQVNRLFRALSQAGMWHDTVVLYTSDHGEMLGDHNLFRKTWPHQSSANIPFLVRLPEWLEPKNGAVIDEPVGLQDVMPTLLDAAGVAIPDSVDGRSVVPLARGERAAWRPYLHGEHHGGRKGRGSVRWSEHAPAHQYLTDGREKYIWYPADGHEHFFDLTRDPHELHNAINDPEAASRVAVWRRRMLEQLRDRPEGFVDGERLVAGRPQLLPDQIRPDVNRQGESWSLSVAVP